MFSYTKKEIVMLAQELNVQKQTLERKIKDLNQIIKLISNINITTYI